MLLAPFIFGATVISCMFISFKNSFNLLSKALNYKNVMTRNFNQGYFGNLHINLDPINFGILFFSKCEKMLFDYCVP